MKQALRHALRAFVRDARGGELGVLFGALVVAVAALTAVGFFTSRVSQAIRLQAAEVLAADLRLESGRAPDGATASQARSRGLSVVQLTSFPSVVYAGEASQLASVLAVGAGYPLRGALRVADVPYGAARVTRGLPGPGEAWADSRLLARLGVAVGGPLQVGALTLRVGAVLDYRPDQGSGLSDLAPTVLIAASDLDATHLLGPGSRATWSLLFAGDAEAVAGFESWLKPRKSAAERLVNAGESSEQMQSASERSGRFLHLAALVTVMLAAVAVAMAARRYAARRLDLVALLKSLGASQRFVLAVTVLELGLVALAGAAVGTLLGYGAESALAWLVRGLLKGALPPPTFESAWLGLGTALTMLAGFVMPPLLELQGVPPARVLRHDLAPAPLRYGAPYVAAALALALLLAVLVRDLKLVGYAVGGLAASALVLGAAGWGLVRATRSVRGGAGLAWRYGLANVARRGRESVVQVVAFGLGLTVLLLLALVRNDLIDEWQRSLPPGAPNHFLVNIPPGEAASLRAFLVAHGVADPVLAPWVRARLVDVNGQPMQARMPKSDRGRAFAEREQNLSWSATLPPDNRLVEGRWWTTPDPRVPEVSVATEFQQELGLHVGDRLGFDVAGEHIEARIANVRKVRWDGFRPNFFLLFAPGVLDASTGTYMTSVHLDAAQRPALATLVREHPSVTVIDVESLLAEVRAIMDRAAIAVEYVFGFTLVAGLAVLFAAIQSTRDERRYESAILRTLGAGRRTVLLGVAAEFTALGLLAGVLAASAASAIGWVVATQLFSLHYVFDPIVWFTGLVGGALGVGVAGTLATRSVVDTAPSRTLREA